MLFLETGRLAADVRRLADFWYFNQDIACPAGERFFPHRCPGDCALLDPHHAGDRQRHQLPCADQGRRHDFKRKAQNYTMVRRAHFISGTLEI